MPQKQNSASVFETSLFGTKLTLKKAFQNPAKIHDKKFELEKIILTFFSCMALVMMLTMLSTLMIMDGDDEQPTDKVTGVIMQAGS